MGNVFNTPEDNYCDFCKDITKTHKTENHRCGICKKRGEHSAKAHKGCKYCIEVHKTKEHPCTKCENKGHIETDHACVLCTEAHHTCYHECSICHKNGHEKTIEEHPQCSLCIDHKKYTHTTKKHIKYVDVNFYSYETRNDYKICDTCECVVYVKDNKCVACDNIIPKFITCPAYDCNYSIANAFVNYCPFCGSNIICLNCFDLIKDYIHDPSDDTYHYYGDTHVCINENN